MCVSEGGWGRAVWACAQGRVAHARPPCARGVRVSVCERDTVEIERVRERHVRDVRCIERGESVRVDCVACSVLRRILRTPTILGSRKIGKWKRVSTRYVTTSDYPNSGSR